MDRNEVLEWLERLAKYEEAKTCGGLVSPEMAAKASKYRDVFCAAAEIIRESGWRPIAEAPEEQALIVGGYWRNGNADEATRPYVWVKEAFQMEKDEAIEEGFTHYLPEPEPPAREVSNDGE